MRRVAEGSYSVAALRQFAPDARELIETEGFDSDPTGEELCKVQKAIVHRYSNRLGIIFTQHCLVYCRFCFRKHFVGKPDNPVDSDDLATALDYVRKHPEIKDVLVSGGDPLAVANSALLPFLEELTSIRTVDVIRIHSRALNTKPDRLDDDLIKFFERSGKIWYYAHLNHPDDIEHPAVLERVGRLQKSGVPVLNQSVLLAGVNDDASVLARLMMACYRNKVLPYHLYVLDRVKGAAHFALPSERVAALYESLSVLPGPAQPVLVYVDRKNTKQRVVFSDHVDLRAFLDSRQT
jgi:KamA family protein